MPSIRHLERDMKRTNAYRLTRRFFARISDIFRSIRAGQEGIHENRRLKIVGALIFTFGIVLFSGCAHEPEIVTVVPITDIKSVAGRWEGMVERQGQRDWVEMVIHDDGAYWTRSYRGIGTYSGKGVFSLVDGKLISRSEKGRSTYVLHQNHGEDVLSLNGTLNELDYTGHFSRANK